MNKTSLVFDLDDTLIHCNKYFNIVLNQFSLFMLDWFNSYALTSEEIQAKQLEIDIAGVEHAGFTLERFPHSLLETYAFFCARFQRSHVKDEERTLWELGYSVYHYEPEPYPKMYETLAHLAHLGYPLHLYTGGDLEFQWKKIRHMQLDDFFENRVFVTTHKNIQTMKHFLSSHQLDPEHAWMIGNSMKTDIVPAIHAGIHSIYIPSQSEWAYNQTSLEIKPKRSYYKIRSLSEIPSLLDEYHLRERDRSNDKKK